MHVTSQDAIVNELGSIVGKENATASKHIRYAYSYDLSFVTPKLPDYVVMATTVEQIQGVLRLANREKIPVVPYTAGTNIGGLTIPERGGILLDLKRMNKIVKLDTESNYAVIEPGVSHAQLASALYKHNLRFGWPVGPPLSLCIFLRHFPWDRRVECPLRIKQPGNHQHGSGPAHRRTGPCRVLRHQLRGLAQPFAHAPDGRTL